MAPRPGGVEIAAIVSVGGEALSLFTEQVAEKPRRVALRAPLL